MAALIKQHEGLIYDEYFHENSLIWSLTPSDCNCLRFELDGLHILHNKNYITYTMKELEEEYCVIAEIDHVPITEEDIAGIIVLADTNNYAECQSYLADSPSTIGNNGENVSSGYDLSNKYVLYNFDDEGEPEQQEEGSPSSQIDTVVNPTNGFVDTIYKFLKVVKYNNKINHTYQFYASADGDTWIEVGNVDYDRQASIGFFLYASTNEVIRRGKFVVNSFRIYESEWITINGINILHAFEFLDSDTLHCIFRSDAAPGYNFVNQHDNNIRINTKSLLLPLHNVIMRVYPKGHYDRTVTQYTLDNFIYGGDIFAVTYDIQLRIDNEIIESGYVHNLGTLFVDSFRKNIVVYNNEDFKLQNIKVSIVPFSEYYSGEEVVKIAIYDQNVTWPKPPPLDEEYNYLEGVPEHYIYNDYAVISEIPAHSGVELVMKLSDVPKQEFYSVANKYRFKILIE